MTVWPIQKQGDTKSEKGFEELLKRKANLNTATDEDFMAIA